MSPATIRVAVVEEFAAGDQPLRQLLDGAPQIEVVAGAGHGDAALAMLRLRAPDVLVVRLVSGSAAHLDTVRRVMSTHPLPVVVCSDAVDAVRARALEAGAVACVEMPRGDAAGDRDIAAALFQTIRLMAEVKVVRRWQRTAPAAARPGAATATPSAAPAKRSASARIVGIGTSTGGPAALRTILGGLPPDFPLPLLVVQHIATGFLPGMADWLAETARLPVQVARHGISPLPGNVYLAPDGFHMGVAGDGTLVLAPEPSATALCPSISFLFRSLAEVYGDSAIGVLLTGMGKDGAQGLKLMRDRGAVTIVQDRDSSVVHGMAGEAIALGAATHVVAAGQVAGALAALARSQPFPERSPE